MVTVWIVNHYGKSRNLFSDCNDYLGNGRTIEDAENRPAWKKEKSTKSRKMREMWKLRFDQRQMRVWT
jgi:hypothetical protein